MIKATVEKRWYTDSAGFAPVEWDAVEHGENITIKEFNTLFPGELNKAKKEYKINNIKSFEFAKHGKEYILTFQTVIRN